MIPLDPLSICYGIAIGAIGATLITTGAVIWEDYVNELKRKRKKG